MGDYVREDADGDLIYVERSADLIKHKGYRVSASEVEATLQDHPTVIGACVVGIPDELVGERIKAIVVLKEDAKGVGGAELIKWCKERLAVYKVPSYIEFRDMLPKSKVGKLLRREVRDEEYRRIAKERSDEMDLLTAITGRRSCRNFLPDVVEKETIMKVLEAATWAPSPLNAQPWEFIVVTKASLKIEIFESAEKTRLWAIEKSGWKWLEKYSIEFLKTAPVIVAVVGNPQKSGVDMFMEDGGVGYQHACAAAVQNMLLAAYAHGLGSCWFTLFDRDAIRLILNVDAGKVPLALVCLGKAAEEPATVPRKGVEKKVVFME
jgi:long-chain acyl-CoA synthetase